LILGKQVKVGVALGSNLGDRWAQVHEGLEFLRSLSEGGYLERSSLYETAPVDCPPGSGTFVNAVAEIEFEGTVRELLGRLQEFELKKGRKPVREINAPRPLDLDILYFGEELVNETDLIIPHPRITERRFVLEPLAEIRPDLVLPGQTKTVGELWSEFGK
jgi:2-amino-4-hydroxy-6-hydroxymethyldihydropteridine diphosphokinase